MCTFVRQGEHAGRVMRDDTALFPKMFDTAHGKLVECTKSKLPLPSPGVVGKEKSLRRSQSCPPTTTSTEVIQPRRTRRLRVSFALASS